jgi:hypothetical protein
MPPKVLALQREAIELKLYHIGIMTQAVWTVLRFEAWGA